MNGFNVDFYVPSKKTIIEVEGPAHFIAPHTNPYELNMTTESRYRILRKNGFKVV